VVTARDIHYVGSITLDTEFIEAAGILPWEYVQVVDVDNGARFETYVIPGERGKKEVQLNGAAAHLVNLGDRVIIMAYGMFTPEEIPNHHPRVVLVNEQNEIMEVRDL
jgi:aspartate 1-decarboxylase